MATNKPVVVIVGPTASGKTGLALKIAERHDSEIICSDSRTVFQEMNIGTAKPTKAEQARVQHWGLDLVKAGERFTAADFQAYANKKVAEIQERGRLPIIVGGTGLYIDGYVFDYEYPAEASAEIQTFLATMTKDELYKYCIDNNIELPENDKNARHLIRKIVHKGVVDSSKHVPKEQHIIVGIATQKQVLYKRIQQRTEQMFDDGVAEEARMLGKKYGWNSEAMSANIYPLMKELLEKRVSEADVKSTFATRDWQLAKRQMTWLRRNPYVLWTTREQAMHTVNNYLADA